MLGDQAETEWQDVGTAHDKRRWRFREILSSTQSYRPSCCCTDLSAEVLRMCYYWTVNISL